MPFWRHGFARPPATSPRDFVARVPARAAACSARTVSWMRCGRTSAVKIASASETSLAFLPLASSMGAFGAAISDGLPSTTTIEFLWPGTAPFTSRRFCSASVSTTVRPTWVTRLPPIRPAILIPLKTREGVAEAPIEPGALTLCEPWVTGPRAKLCRLTVPWKPLPIEMPETFTRSPGSNASTVTVSPGVSSCGAADLDQLAVRLDAVLPQMPETRALELPLRHGVERELHRVVAVVVRGADGDDRARAGLDHGHGRERAGLRVEDLRHPELASDDALHLRA